MASLDDPKYTVYLVAGKTKYNITPAVTAIELNQEEKEIAQSCTLTVANFKATKDKTMAALIQVRQRIFVYANDGKKKGEVFRGWTWTRLHTSEMDEEEITIKCYDGLIYLQQSEDAFYFSKGKKTKEVMQTICKKWGIKLSYSYSNITHGKLALRGKLSDLFMNEILLKVKRKTGNEYVIYSEKDKMYVKACGKNKTIYAFKKKENVTSMRYEQTMEDMITKVVIVASANKKNDGKLKTKATVKGDTKKYGTLQKLEDAGDKLADAKKEAKYTIKDYGKPDENIELKTADIPWIKKGDKVYVNAGHIAGKYMIVAGIEREISNKEKTMTLLLKRPVGNAKK